MMRFIERNAATILLAILVVGGTVAAACIVFMFQRLA